MKKKVLLLMVLLLVLSFAVTAPVHAASGSGSMVIDSTGGYSGYIYITPNQGSFEITFTGDSNIWYLIEYHGQCVYSNCVGSVSCINISFTSPDPNPSMEIYFNGYGYISYYVDDSTNGSYTLSLTPP